MSKAGTLPTNDIPNISLTWKTQDLPSLNWLEHPFNETKDVSSDVTCSPLDSTLDFMDEYVIDNQARSMMKSLYKLFQRLSQTAVTAIHLSQSSLSVEEQCLWISMPPLATREIIVDFEHMGRGEPLDFNFDEDLTMD